MSRPLGAVRPRIVPELGARIPGYATRVAFVAVAAPLCFDRYPTGFWLVVGLALTAGAVAAPRHLYAWALLLLLGASQLSRDPSPYDWHFFVLLAGLHLLHVLAASTLAYPWRSWVQLAAIRPPLRRYLAIQVPVQLVALLTLSLLAPSPDGGAHVTVPAVGIVGAAALVLITLRLIVPMLRERARAA
jgi:hypothetical protein